MERMLNKVEQSRNNAFDVENLNRLAALKLIESDAGRLEEKWEDLAGEEFDEACIHSPDEVGLGNWFATGYDD